MGTYKYFKWDGTEPFSLDKEKLMNELSRRLMADGNLNEALWRMQNSRMRDGNNRKMPTLKDLLRRLNERRQSQLGRYDLDSIMDDIPKALEDVIQTRRNSEKARRPQTKSPAGQ
jgi:uncharacterized protein with von Willebrand factor type A (vWA) domain